MATLPKCKGCNKQYNAPHPCAENRAPLLLRCGHTFCKRCIMKWACKRKHLNCPICDVRTDWPDGMKSAEKLWPNVYYAGVIACGSAIPSLSQYFSRIDHISSTTRPEEKEVSTTKCTECIASTATCRCMHCLVDMCDKCFVSVHAHSRLLRHHKKVPLRPSLTRSECAEHQRLLEFYCEDDKTPVCPDCMISPTHKNHNIVRMASKYDAYEKEIKEAKSKAESCLLFSSKVKSRIEAELHKVKTDAYQQAEAIYSHFLDCISNLQVNFLVVIKELEDSAEVACKELISHLEEIEAKEIAVKDACSDAELVISKDVVMKIVVDPEKLLASLKSSKSLPYDLDKSTEAKACKIESQVALRSEYFEFLPSPEMLKLFENFGKIVVKKGFKYKMMRIENSLSILDALPRKKAVIKPQISAIREIDESRHNNARELVGVKFVDSPADFTVQRLADRPHVDAINRCLRHLKMRKPSVNDHFDTIAVGELCAAHYDRDGTFYRARVLRRVEQGTHIQDGAAVGDSINIGVERIMPNHVVEVYFIDYGNTAMSEVKALRHLPEQLKKLPGLSIACCLGDICPVSGQDWSSEAKQYFAKIVSQRPLLMTTTKREKGIRFVVLHRPPADEIDGDVPMSITDALVFLGFAKYQDQAVRSDEYEAANKKFLTPVPLAINSLNSVTVSQLFSPGRFNVQQTGSHSTYLEEMSRKIQSWVKKHISGKHAANFRDAVHHLQICLAHFSPDNRWYRADILELNKDRTVKVEYVDYGNVDTVKFSKLIKIPEIFTHLPAQSLSCELHRVKPLPEEKTFSLLCIKRMAELCSNCELIMEIRDMKGNKYYVDLFDSCDEDPSIVSISDRLYREGLVTYEKQIDTPEITISPDKSEKIQENEVEDVKPIAKKNHSVKIKARVTHVTSPALFYLQTETQIADLNTMMHTLQEGMENCSADNNEVLDVGSICAVLSKKEKRWCRGVLEHIGTGDEECRVTAIDFGWQELVSLSVIRDLPKEFVDTEVFVSRCALECVRPAGGSSNWTSTAIDYFKELVNGKECMAEIGEKNGNERLSADLWIGEQDFGFLDEEMSLLTQISKALIMQGVALPCKASKKEPSRSSGPPCKSVDEMGRGGQVMSDAGGDNSPLCEKWDCKNSGTLPSEVLKVERSAALSEHKLERGDGSEPNRDNCEISLAYDVAYPSLTLLKVGTMVPCCVSHVHDHETFYVTRNLTVNESQDVSTLLDETFDWKMSMNEVQYLKKGCSIPLEDVRKMMPCLSLYEEDQRLHRAIILSTELLPESVLIQYIDFGTLEETTPCKLRHVPDVSRALPVQSFLCRLADSCGERPVDDNYTPFLTEEFGRTVQGQYLDAEIQRIEKPAPEFAHFLRCYVVSLHFK